MKIHLMEHTPNPDRIVVAAARQCYSEGFVGDDYLETDRSSDTKLLRKVLSMGHTSVLEHASFTFGIEGMSRVTSHQLVRFRVASYSQQSQRYCFLGEDFRNVEPPTVQYSNHHARYLVLMKQIGQFYNDMVKDGIPAEDARYVLPNACETNLVMTMNARELFHAFNLRCCVHAQWEIRDMFEGILCRVRNVAPVIFEKAGPACVSKGVCSEGPRCCGRGTTLSDA